MSHSLDFPTLWKVTGSKKSVLVARRFGTDAIKDTIRYFADEVGYVSHAECVKDEIFEQLGKIEMVGGVR
jgi:hypothetical protein